MNNYLEGWFSLKWFYPSQILSYEWGNININPGEMGEINISKEALSTLLNS